MPVTGLFGSVFDPPHDGHVALLRDARAHFGFDRVVVLVVGDPGHKRVDHRPAVRLELARLAFPDDDVELDPHPRTVDMLRERQFEDPVFLVGADQFADFLTWKEPDERARAGAARCRHTAGISARSAGRRPCLAAAARSRLVLRDRAGRISSSEVRARVAHGEPIDGLVPPAVGRRSRDAASTGGG